MKTIQCAHPPHRHKTMSEEEDGIYIPLFWYIYIYQKTDYLV